MFIFSQTAIYVNTVDGAWRLGLCCETSGCETFEIKVLIGVCIALDILAPRSRQRSWSTKWALRDFFWWQWWNPCFMYQHTGIKKLMQWHGQMTKKSTKPTKQKRLLIMIALLWTQLASNTISLRLSELTCRFSFFFFLSTIDTLECWLW